MTMIKIIQNKNRGGAVDTSAYSFAATENIRNLHASLKVYKETPLIELKNFKGVRSIFIKDESQRFGRKAFKGFGAPGLRGGKPRNVQLDVGSPESTSATSAADGPGTAVTGSPSATASRTSRKPGSETHG